MPTVVTTAAIVTCLHGGQPSPALTSPAKLSVGGNRVIPADLVPTWVLAKCSQVSPQTPCTGINPSGGQAAKLTLGGKPALLSNLRGTTNGNPDNSFTLTESQTKATAS